MSDKNQKTSAFALEGNERAVPYKIQPPQKDVSRFSFGAKVFSDNLGSVIFINLLMVVFIVPIFILFLYKGVVNSQNGVVGPFGDNVGIGYPAFPDLSGVRESIVLNNDVVFFAIAIALSLFAAVGLAGGIYAVAKLMRSEERFRFVDFFVGIKKNYLPSAIACLLGFIGAFLTVVSFDLMRYNLAIGSAVAGYVALFIVALLASLALCMFALWLLSVATAYSVNAKSALFFAVSMPVKTVLPTLFFLVMAVIPALLGFIPFLTWLVTPLYVMFGFVYALIVWVGFSDWAFDNYANYFVNVKVAQSEEERKEKEKASNDKDLLNLLLIGGKNSYLSRPVQPISEGESIYLLPEKYTVEDVKKLQESRKKMADSAKEYEQKNCSQAKYVEYNAKFAEREKPLSEKTKKGKEKKFNPTMLSN